jgi:hypothetical protein
MINVTRIKQMIFELRPNEEFIQWIDEHGCSIRLYRHDRMISLRLHNRKNNKQIQRAFLMEEFDKSKADFLPYCIDRMVKDINL